MSGETTSPSFKGAERVEDEAAAWLWRRAGAEWRPEDQLELDAWLAESLSHLAVFWRLEAAWERAERLGALRRPTEQRGPLLTHGRIWTILGAVAAVIIGVTISGVTWDNFWPTPHQIYSTAVGGRATIKLADGSRVELNTDTTISASVNAQKRTIELKRGEAYFQIQHDRARPFVVLAAGHRIVDLGTKFSVRTTGDSLKVILVEGRARLETANTGVQQHSTELTPGEVVVATANSMSISKKAPDELTDALAWKRGMLVFRHIALGDAAEEFNRYNRTKLVVGSDIASLKINGTFEADSIDAFARMAQFALKLRAAKTNDEIRLTH